jgi:hypothetical protein
VPVRAKRVDAYVRVARMDEDLLILFIPGVQRVSVETGRASYLADRLVTENTHGAWAVHAAGPQAVTACRPLAEALLAVLIDEETLVDVLNRDVVLGVVRPFPHVPRPRSVEDQLTAQRRPYSPLHGFCVIVLRDHLRIITIAATGDTAIAPHSVSR